MLKLNLMISRGKRFEGGLGEAFWGGLREGFWEFRLLDVTWCCVTWYGMLRLEHPVFGRSKRPFWTPVAPKNAISCNMKFYDHHFFSSLRIFYVKMATAYPSTEKTIFLFSFQWMGYDRDDSFWAKGKFPFVQKPSPRSYPIHSERKWKHSFLSVVGKNPV